MKVGIVGAGMIVHDFLTFAHEVTGMELVALCATPAEKEKIVEMCQANNIKAHYTNIDVMLEDSEVEVVYVAVPNHLHYEMCKKAILAGKHVICEKPFTSNLKELEELVALADTNKVIMVEAVSTQYLPNTLKIKELLPTLGQIMIVSANYSQYSSRYDAFKAGEVLPAFNPAMSGGALMDLNIYNINLVVALFGKPLNVNYEANIQRGIDTSGILTLDYDSFKCVCIGAKDCKAPVATNIQGDAGCITISTPANSLNGFKVLMNKGSAKQMNNEGDEVSYNNDKHRMYHEFVEFVKMIDEKDFTRAKKMQEISLITIEIATKARQSAGIEFAADK